MGAMDANMVELAERIPVFAEAQVLPRSTANLSELRMFFPARTALFSALLCAKARTTLCAEECSTSHELFSA
jgi:hypothetical protein